jgi:hypothetical protein
MPVQCRIGDMGIRRWDQERRRLVPVDPPSEKGREEWPFYCATFHVGVKWYAEHRSDELFYFVTSMQPGWPLFSTDPGNWPHWVRLADALLGEYRSDDPPYDRHQLIAAAYVAEWGSRDVPNCPGVRDLAAAMSGRDATGQLLEGWWLESVERCLADPEDMGGPYEIPAPPSG